MSPLGLTALLPLTLDGDNRREAVLFTLSTSPTSCSTMGEEGDVQNQMAWHKKCLFFEVASRITDCRAVCAFIHVLGIINLMDVLTATAG
jgi:hypothetical protein